MSPALCVRFMTKRFIGEYDNKKGETTEHFFKIRITIVHIILGFIITLCVKTDVTYRCSRMVDQETVEVEILDIPYKVYLTNSQIFLFM